MVNPSPALVVFQGRIETAMKMMIFLFSKFKFLFAFIALALGGCASINFDSDDPQGLAYFEAKPYLLYSQTADCVSSVTPVTLPGKKKTMSFSGGLGSSDLSVSLSDGIITSVGLTADPKLSEGITSIAALAALMVGDEDVSCPRVSLLIPIDNTGSPDQANSINLLVLE